MYISTLYAWTSNMVSGLHQLANQSWSEIVDGIRQGVAG